MSRAGARWLVVALLGAVVAAGIFHVLRRGTEQAAESPYEYGRPDRQRLPKMTLLNHQSLMHSVFGEPVIEVKTIGILVYDGVDTVEAVAPMVVFSELLDVKLEYVGVRPGRVRTSLVDIEVERSFDQVGPLDLLVVPGGESAAVAALATMPDLKGWLQRMDAGAKLVAGIGNGNQLLAAANVPTPDLAQSRYRNQGRRWVAAGGLAAIDASLAMLQAIVGTRHLQAAMLDLEYDPQPPRFDDAPAAPAAAGSSAPLQVGILVYPDFFTLDALGPLAVLSGVEGLQVRLVRHGGEEILKSGRTRFHVPATTRETDRLDVLVVPGGSTGTWAMTQDAQALAWIRAIDAQSRVTASVCTGSWVLGAAGLLEGRRATTNWYRARQMMQHYGARFEPARYVQDGKYWTSAGVSAGIDLGFAVLAELQGVEAAREAMDRLDYRPAPPIDAGTPEKTDDLVLDMVHQMYDYTMLPLIAKDRAHPR